MSPTSKRVHLPTWLGRAQGLYYALTGLWPIVSLGTFMLVTGPKTDGWLVKTVGGLAISIGLTLISSARTEVRAAKVLGTTSATAFFLIDVIYASLHVISPIYLADAVAEAGFIVLWLLFTRPEPNRK